jgi:F-type H+-transporting ATPase subunit c
MQDPAEGCSLSVVCVSAVQREGASTVSLNHPLTARLTGAWSCMNTMRTMKYVFMSLAAMLIASPAFAQSAAASPGAQWVPLAAGLGMALAAGLCGIGQGRATASSAEALARNPGARPGIFLFLILGLAFIESLALFTFLIIIIKVK